MPYGNNMINQLYRQKDNIESMIAQYADPQHAPVQNIINTFTSTNDTEIKYLSKNDDVNNIIIMKKTVFIDEYNNKIMIKELDGTISKSYDIIVPNYDLFKDNVEYYARYSYDFIKDEDAVDDKVYYYFTMLPKN